MREKSWAVLLKPGWIVTALLVVAFSYLALTVLSPWQLGKDHAIVERNQQVERAFSIDPVGYSDLFDAEGRIRGDAEWQRARLSGHYLEQQEVLLRLRPVESGPSYQALTPFKLNEGPVLLINRGFEPTEAGQAPVIAAPPKGEVTIVVHARRDEDLPQTAPMRADGFQQVYGIHTEQIGQLVGLSLAKDYAQLSDEEPGALHPMPIPKQDRGNHLSYGFQWIAFGIMAPLGLAYFVRSELKERKREAAEQAAMHEEASQTSKPPTQAEQAHAPQGDVGTQAQVRNNEAPPAPSPRQRRPRYGRAHGQRFQVTDKRRDRF